MRIVAFILGLLLIGVVLWFSFFLFLAVLALGAVGWLVLTLRGALGNSRPHADVTIIEGEFTQIEASRPKDGV